MGRSRVAQSRRSSASASSPLLEVSFPKLRRAPQLRIVIRAILPQIAATIIQAGTRGFLARRRVPLLIADAQAADSAARDEAEVAEGLAGADEHAAEGASPASAPSPEEVAAAIRIQARPRL